MIDGFLGELRKCADIHAGEACYIFGDGPSIKWFDLTLFKDKPAICCNMFPFHKDFRELDVRYCTLTTPRYFAPKFLRNKDYLIDGQAISREYRNFVMNYKNVNFLFHLTNYFFISGSNVNFGFRKLPDNANHTIKLINSFNPFGGGFYSTLSLAYYLGFKKIYLVGFDAWTIQPARNKHWYELGEGVLFEPVNIATDFLELLKGEVDIYTISMGGQSKNVMNINYEAHTGKPLIFKENYDLVSEHHLRVLATYPGYRIYP